MKVLRIKAFQPFACYRKPFSYGFWDTFPLPPFSTLNGLFHYGINADPDKYYPVNIAVAGVIGNITYDLQTLIKFDRDRSNEGKKQIILEGFRKAFSKSPTYVATVTNVNLRIYFQAELKLLEKLKRQILTNYFPYIGRYEDLARIDDISLITPQEKKFTRSDRLSIGYSIYLKPETAKTAGIIGSNFQLPYRFQEINGLRYFNKEKVVFTDSGELKNGTFVVDDQTDEFIQEPVLIELFGDYKE